MTAVFWRCALGVSFVLLAGCGGANIATVPIEAGRDVPQNVLRATLAGNTDSKRHRYSVLYSFTGYADGSWPRGGVIEDASGAFYGTTELGGSSPTCAPYNEAPCGTVFKLTPSSSGYTESVLHNFTGRRSDGADPMAGLTFGEDGALYGTTSSSDRGNGCGTVFKLTPSGSGYMERTVYKFSGPPFPIRGSCDPQAGLVFGRGGALYGTTVDGGATGRGNAFKLRLSGSRYVERTIHQFTPDSGARPESGLTLGKGGALYGTTYFGGSNNRGVVYKLTPRDRSRYAETVLFSFNGNGLNGMEPDGGVTFDKSGALYGITYRGGKPWCDCGTIFKLTPSGSGYKETILYRFGGKRPGDEPQGGGHGGGAQGGLIFGNDGALYGTSLLGGTYGYGMVFRIVP